MREKDSMSQTATELLVPIKLKSRKSKRTKRSNGQFESS